MTSSLTVTDSVQFSYYDSGKPNKEIYTTLFIVHGLGFGASVFIKTLSMAPDAGIRVVSINRPGYFGSSPPSQAQNEILQNGNDHEKADLLREFGQNLATFIDKFVQANNIPPISEDGRVGGFGILAWSFGSVLALGAVANIPSLDPEARLRFKARLRSVILHEPPPIALGLPAPPPHWVPFMDESCLMPVRLQMFQQWVTAYFQHKSVTSQISDDLSYVVPATFRTPSIFNMPAADQATFLDQDGLGLADLGLGFALAPLLQQNLETVCFDKSLKTEIPHMKVVSLTGESSPAFAQLSLWQIQDRDQKHGGGHVEFKIIPGWNHFPHWDEPARCLGLYIESL